MLHNEHGDRYYKGYNRVAGNMDRPFEGELVGHGAEDGQEKQGKG